MTKKIIILCITLAACVLVTPSCKKKGCTDENSISYDSKADKDDGSC